MTQSTDLEIKNIFVSCLHNETKEGGLYVVKENYLHPIFEGTTCHGLFFHKNQNTLFCVTRIEPQIIAFKIIDTKYTRIPIIFKDYIFANDAHGISIINDKIHVVATDGEKDGQTASNTDGPGTHIGKIIISELVFFPDHIEIKNSILYNPFGCSHHHHINDLISNGINVYLSAFSYCDEKKNYIKNGAILKLEPNKHPKLVVDDMIHPHTLAFYEAQLFFCSSSESKIYSFNLLTKELKLEYKGPNSFVRGLFVTSDYIYFGISESMGRTDAEHLTEKFYGLLKFHRRTGETKLISCPPHCNNIYAIQGTN